MISEMLSFNVAVHLNVHAGVGLIVDFNIFGGETRQKQGIIEHCAADYHTSPHRAPVRGDVCNQSNASARTRYGVEE
jgi:hypothetical protein